jgi:hypothetical protein
MQPNESNKSGYSVPEKTTNVAATNKILLVTSPLSLDNGSKLLLRKKTS